MDSKPNMIDFFSQILLVSRNPTSPLRNPDNSLATSDLDKSNQFASDLENRFTLNAEETNRDHINHIETSLTTTLSTTCQPTKHTILSETQYLFEKLPRNKFPERDLITSSVIKRLPKICYYYVPNTLI